MKQYKLNKIRTCQILSIKVKKNNNKHKKWKCLKMGLSQNSKN